MTEESKPEFENAEYLDKETTETHKGLADYIRKTTGKKVSPAMAALVLRLYSVYLKSPDVVEAREAEKAQKEAERRKREEKKFEAKRRKLAKIEADRARLLADLGLEEDGGPDAEVEDGGEVVEASDRFVGTPDEVEVEEPESEEDPPWDEDESSESEGISVDESEDKFQIPDEDEDDEDDDWAVDDDDDDDEEEEDF